VIQLLVGKRLQGLVDLEKISNSSITNGKDGFRQGLLITD
jgi:hypothetical protein